MKYLEYALADPKHRNQILEIRALDSLIREKGGAVPIYRSTYFYDDDIISFMEKNKSIKNYNGKRYINTIPVDIDKGTNSDQFTLLKLRKFLEKLDGYKIMPDAYQVYFSGTGYHVSITNQEFGFMPDEDLPIRVETTLMSLGLCEDKSVLRKSAIIRAPHTINLKSNLFKIPLTNKEARTLSFQDIHKLAREPRLDYPYVKTRGNGTFIGKVVEIDKQMPEKTRIYNQDSTGHLMHYVCFQKMMNEGPVQGNRNDTVLRLASHLKWTGILEDYAIELLKYWNTKTEESLDEKEIINRVKYVYRSAIKYGCKDHIMTFYCRPSCKDYKSREQEGDINPLNFEALNQQFKERKMMMKRSNEFINLKDIFGLDQDCVLYPGELVTFIGDTGVNKTSIIQNIVLGLDMRNQKFIPHKQNVLFYETELGGGGIQERFLCMLTGLTRAQLYMQPGIEDQYKNAMSNISVQSGQINLQGIEAIISKYQYDIVVIDYIEKILHPMFDKGNDVSAVSDIMKKLSSMASKYQIVIICISQVPKSEVVPGKRINMHSGKGSAAIAHSSRRIFCINGAQKSRYRAICQEKANNDQTFDDIMIERQANWRFIRR